MADKIVARSAGAVSRMTDTADSLVLGLQALATLVRRGPIDIARLARLNGWRTSYATALVSVLEKEGLVQREGDPAKLVVTPRAVALIGEDRPTRSLH